MLHLVLKSLWIVTVDVCPSYMRIECVYSTLPHTQLMRHSRDTETQWLIGNSGTRYRENQAHTNDVSTHKQVLTSKASNESRPNKAESQTHNTDVLSCRDVSRKAIPQSAIRLTKLWQSSVDYHRRKSRTATSKSACYWARHNISQRHRQNTNTRGKRVDKVSALKQTTLEQCTCMIT